MKVRQGIDWRNVFMFIYTHATAVYALTQFPPHWYTVYYNLGLCVWVGLTLWVCHRLWAYNSYKTNWLLRLIPIIGQNTAFQFSIYKWSWLHRVHRKFTDTDADPRNSKRGFFYSHIGWILHQYHEEVLQKKDTMDLRDLEEDWMVMGQHRLFPVIGPIICFVLPALTPVYYWGEDVMTAWNFSVLRWVLLIHVTSIITNLWVLDGDDGQEKKPITRSYPSETKKSG